MKSWIAILFWTTSVFAGPISRNDFVAPWANALPFELPWMNHESKGTIYRSLDNPAGIFVIEAYFLNCPYCNDNAPEVDDLATKYASEPRVHVLDVGVDKNDTQYASWISKHSPNHPVLKDGNRKLISILGTSGYPSTYVIDCRGNVAASTSGSWGAGEKRTITDAIDKLLTQECPL